MLHNFRRIRTLDVGFRACCDGEWFREVEGCFLVFVDVDAGDEGLVGEALPVWVGVLVEALAVDQGSQGFHNLFAGVLVVFALDAAVDAGETRTDAVLVAFPGGEVDGARHGLPSSARQHHHPRDTIELLRCRSNKDAHGVLTAYPTSICKRRDASKRRFLGSRLSGSCSGFVSGAEQAV
ncbi:hypothetical protein LJ114_11390 [Propionibacterium freudenreichii]|uniref:hypothetical protein n=2 Tax=Propionibacterium freudenreichii TaxID=1744 RepID=UPI0011C907CE|nr:hypothetical protein [Propionibacterium freudenreichii]WBF61839.1 hypothetical protein LJ114_11390 [Propionibacterium freudenreichii]